MKVSDNNSASAEERRTVERDRAKRPGETPVRRTEGRTAQPSVAPAFRELVGRRRPAPPQKQIRADTMIPRGDDRSDAVATPVQIAHRAAAARQAAREREATPAAAPPAVPEPRARSGVDRNEPVEPKAAAEPPVALPAPVPVATIRPAPTAAGQAPAFAPPRFLDDIVRYAVLTSNGTHAEFRLGLGGRAMNGASVRLRSEGRGAVSITLRAGRGSSWSAGEVNGLVRRMASRGVRVLGVDVE